jgi:hypothetical protein
MDFFSYIYEFIENRILCCIYHSKKDGNNTTNHKKDKTIIIKYDTKEKKMMKELYIDDVFRSVSPVVTNTMYK